MSAAKPMDKMRRLEGYRIQVLAPVGADPYFWLTDRQLRRYVHKYRRSTGRPGMLTGKMAPTPRQRKRGSDG